MAYRWNCKTIIVFQLENIFAACCRNKIRDSHFHPLRSQQKERDSTFSLGVSPSFAVFGERNPTLHPNEAMDERKKSDFHSWMEVLITIYLGRIKERRRRRCSFFSIRFNSADERVCKCFISSAICHCRYFFPFRMIVSLVAFPWNTSRCRNKREFDIKHCWDFLIQNFPGSDKATWMYVS